MSNQIEKVLYYDLQDSLGECGNVSYEAYMARCNEVNLKVASIPVNYDRFEIQEGRNAIRLKALGQYQVGTVNYWEQKRELYDDGGKLVDEGTPHRCSAELMPDESAQITSACSAVSALISTVSVLVCVIDLL